MTRRLTITNLSNWEGEDYLIRVKGRPTKILRPGDSHDLVDIYSSASAEHEAIESIHPKPFMDEAGKQVLPEMRVVFE